MNTRRLRFTMLSAALIAGVMMSTVFGIRAEDAAKKAEASKLDRAIAQAVCAIMEQGHISRHKIDDLISSRIHKQFLQLFDPLKLYFLEEDIKEFAAKENVHDDQAMAGDLSFEFEVYQRYLKRMDERIEWAREFAKEKFDFTKEESIDVDPDTAKYAKTAEESKDMWRKRIKFELLTLMVDGKNETEARERIDRRYRNLSRRWHQVDNDELLEMYLTALTNSFDPHSTYMSPRTLEDFTISMQLSLEGIGAMLQSEDGLTIVKEIVPGGAADKDGRIKPGDQIVGVGEGEKGELVDIVDMKLRDVVEHIRGKAGTTVRLEVKPANADKRLTYLLTRQKIELQDREARGEVIELPQSGNAPKMTVGVIKLPSFYADNDAIRNGAADAKTATNDVRRILEDFKGKGVQGVIVDLRTNGGGLLSEAIGLTGLFIDEGPVVQVKDYNKRITPYMDEIPGVAYDGPLVVLVSKFSASASEIFAGAIQDYGRGIIVGDSSTHGKGTVQKILDLGRQFIKGDDNMGAVKLTMQQFYRVNGDSTQNAGVRSDVVLPSTTDMEEFGESKLDYALNFDRVPKADYDSMRQISPNLVEQLRKLSGERLTKEKDLIDLTKRKERAETRRARKTLTYSEEKLRQERAELNDEEREELKKAEEDDLGHKDEKKFDADAYGREVLSILCDFIRLKDSTFTAR